MVLANWFAANKVANFVYQFMSIVASKQLGPHFHTLQFINIGPHLYNPRQELPLACFFLQHGKHAWFNYQLMNYYPQF